MQGRPRADGARCPGSIAKPFPLAMSVEYIPAAMASTLTTADVGGSALRAPVSSARWQQRLFFTAIPIAMAVAVFVGFAPTYYLKTAYRTPALAPLFHLHGFLFSLWIVLLVAQPALVAARRINLHRRLGIVGGVLAAAMVPTALAVAVDMARRGAAPPGVPPLSFLAVPLATVIVFPALIGAALAWRRQPEMHKRLMLIGTLELVPAGVARWPGLITAGPLAYFGLTDLFLVAIVLFDVATRGRPHPATIWGGLFLVASQVLRIVISGTGPWLAFAGWLIG
jgi:hypothetical protein